MPQALKTRNDFTSLLDAVNEAEQSGDAERALALSLEALALDPQHITLRSHVAVLLAEQGRLAEAEKVLREGLDAQPESVSLARNLSKNLAEQGRFNEAVELARDLIWPLRKESDFRMAYAAWLARIGDEQKQNPPANLAALWGELHANEKAIEDEWLLELEAKRQPNAAPMPPSPAYVRALFDCYAETFDEHLAKLSYCAPAVMRKAIDRAMPGRSNLDIIDLGCGTGLVGAGFKTLAYRLVGIDCAHRMIIRAKRRKIYDLLIEGDMVAELKKLPPGSADLITAGDVLIYTGDLKELMIQVTRVLRPGGFFTASVEAGDGNAQEFTLQSTRRYTHGEAYIRRLAASSLLDVLSFEPFTMRREGKVGIKAIAFVIGKVG